MASSSTNDNAPLFGKLGLHPKLLQAIEEEGYSQPSPIQQKAIPQVLAGRDVMAAAQTGTGKTAGFTLPLLQRLMKGKPATSNQARALVLTPTRELAAQVGASIATYGRHLPLRSDVVYGGVKINPQLMRMRKGCDVLVATPGRLLDLYKQNAVQFKHLEILVLDEADRMLDMGFIHDIRKILAVLPAKRQNLMFSATFSPDILKLAKSLVHAPVEISVNPTNSTANTVKQHIYPVDKKRKSSLLLTLQQKFEWRQVLVFTKTKHGANKLTRFLEGQGVKAKAIHGDKSQGARTRALEEFKSGEIDMLIATDIAARGIDIDQLPQVVNFDLPHVPEDYVHRIGRTGRAGAAGRAISLVSADEHKQLVDIENLIGKLLPRTIEEGYDPKQNLPESKLTTRPKKPKKPKKPKVAKTDHRDGQRSGENAHGHGAANDRQGHGKQGRTNQRAARRPKAGAKGKGQAGAKTPSRPAGSATAKPKRTPRRSSS